MSEIQGQERRGAAPLAAMAALGIVFGDLGTSPLYTMQTIVGALGPHANAESALGVLSLIFWTLLITISVKYCLFVMRADNHGEGGIMALMSLVGMNDWRRGTMLGASMGLLGAALIYGDGVITPAISVLSALEGVNVATAALKPFIVPVAIGILVVLFGAQRFGTAAIGKAFGPIMLVWFIAIGVLGLAGIMRHPAVLAAINPVHGALLIISSGPTALLILGGVFLCATGGEALYADMGHFGPFPIRMAWYGIVLPTLLLSYAGQTALLLDGPARSGNPFFLLAPSWAVIPLVALATAATIIASQAIITGSFSMTRQAMQLGWMPGFHIRQTSDKVYGQIYVPAINLMMALATIGITLAFRTSDNLAGAYGTAVSTTMVLTTLLLSRAMITIWRWPLALVIPVAGVFLAVDLSFFAANLAKIVDGGWIPLTLGAMIFIVMVTWRTGIQSLRTSLAATATSSQQFFADLVRDKVARVPGTSIFLTRADRAVPSYVIDYVRNVGALHENVILLHIEFEECPRVADEGRCSVEPGCPGVWHVGLKYGFVEAPNLPVDLAKVKGLPAQIDLSKAIFFASRDVVDAKTKNIFSKWRLVLFAFLFRNAVRLTDRFSLPRDRTFEVSRHVDI